MIHIPQMMRYVSPFAAAAAAFVWPERVKVVITPNACGGVYVVLSVTKSYQQENFVDQLKKNKKQNVLDRTSSSPIICKTQMKRLGDKQHSYHNQAVISIRTTRRFNTTGRIRFKPVKQMCCPRGKITFDIL